MNSVGAKIALYMTKEVPTLFKLGDINIGKMFLIVGLIVGFFSAQVRANANDDQRAEAAKKKCTTEHQLPAGTNPTTGFPIPPSVDIDARRSCMRAFTELLADERDQSSCNEACKKRKNRLIFGIRADFQLPADSSETQSKDRCDAIYDTEKDSINECKKMDMKVARSCAKSGSGDDDLLQGETMQMAAPFLGMVSGADALLGAYTAMNDKPGCYLNKTDFLAKEDKLNDQKKEIEDRIKKTMEDAETAQSEYSAKLKEWSEKEGEIADKLEAIPGETADNKDKLDADKVKTKMQADSKYNAVMDQMAELRRKYNEMVDAKSVAMAENSDFVIHDRCAEIAAPKDSSKQDGPKQPSPGVQNSFAGAFAQGKVLATNVQKRYNACMDRERKKQKRVENSVLNELSSIKFKLQSLDTVLGHINEEKRIAEQEINKQIAKLAESADKEIKKLARDYQRIQSDKQNEQTLLKQKLERLSAANKKDQQQLAILGMKLSAYTGKRPPKTINDKSMAEMMDQCGAGFTEMLTIFKRDCCKGTYSGAGFAVCSLKPENFDITRRARPSTNPRPSSTQTPPASR